MKLAWGKKVSADFVAVLLPMAQRLQVDPSCLTASMAFETGETFSPAIRNAAGSGAVGLIQFMPATARALGTTVENLELLSAASQLTYVEQYFRPYTGRLHTLSDVYMAILWPRAIGKPEGYVLFSKGIAAYRQNGPLDSNSDGRITKAEAASRAQAKLVKGMQPAYCLEY